MMLPPGHRFAGDRGYHFFALSPDGRAIAYIAWSGSGASRMHVRRLDRREDVELPGTEGARNMFFSPDGEWIGFFNSQSMCKVSVRGGSPVVLAEAGQDRGGTWLDDGTIVYSYETTVPLLRMPATGGAAVAASVLDTLRRERTHRFPCALAGGPWVVFTVGRTDSPGGYDDSPIDAVNVKTGERRQLVKGARRAVWAPPGYLVFDRSGDLYAMRIDPRDPRPGPEPFPVLDGVAGEASSGAGFFEVSNDGTIAWMREESGGDQREIGWMDRTGRWTPTKLPAAPYVSVRLSPDGGRVLAAAGPGGGSSDLWVGDLAGGAMNRLTYGGASAQGAWTADGQRMVFPLGDSLGGNSIVVRRLDGAGEQRVLFRAPWPLVVTGLTPDGGAVLFCDYGRAAGRMRVASLSGDAAVRELPADPGNERNEQAGVVSPDGRWLAYVSNRTRREEVYVRSFDGTGGRWQVSTGGGGGVRWGRDSRELFFVEQGGERLARVPLEVRGADLVIGQPEPLFEATPDADGADVPRFRLRPPARSLPLHPPARRHERAPRAGALDRLDLAPRGEDARAKGREVTLSPGTKLGPYEILAPLGAGGMGEVYRARDTRLGRDVAVKVLPQHLSANPGGARALRARGEDRLEPQPPEHLHAVRRRAARASTDYLVMELVEGETLAERLRKGPLPTAELLRLGAQIADALDRAHRAGVIHRDLKPGNVMLTRSGREAHGLRPRARDRHGRARGRERPRAGGAHAVADGRAGADRRGHDRRHVPVHVARAARGQGGRRAQRHLGAGLRALRDGDGQARVRGPQPGERSSPRSSSASRPRSARRPRARPRATRRRTGSSG